MSVVEPAVHLVAAQAAQLVVEPAVHLVAAQAAQ